MSFDSVFHGAPTSNNGQAIPSGQATLGIDVTAGQIYYKDPSHSGWQGIGGPYAGDVFVGPGLTPFPMNGVNTGKSTIFGLNTGVGANGIVAVKFFLNRVFTISKVSWSATDTSAGSKVSFGIYNTALNKLVDSGTFDGSISTSQTNTITPVTLQPGTYWLAMTATDTTVSGVSAINVTTGNFWAYINNASTKIGISTVVSVAGVMPNSLGSITSTVGSSSTTYWMPVFE